ncbi:MAG: Type leader peptidase family [Actinomycetota bacterium]
MSTIFLLLTLGLAIRASWIDAKTGLLPNKLNLFIFLSALGWIATSSLEVDFLSYVLVVLGHLALVLLPKVGLGAGDLKLIFGLGLLAAGLNQIWTWLTLAYVLAGIWGLLHLNNRNIRFGPWLTAALVAIVVGEFTPCCDGLLQVNPMVLL